MLKDAPTGVSQKVFRAPLLVKGSTSVAKHQSPDAPDMQLVRMTTSTGEEDVEGDLTGELMIIKENRFCGEQCWVSWRRRYASGLILQNDIQRMNDTRNVAKNRQ
jgi:hypothetical protein